MKKEYKMTKEELNEITMIIRVIIILDRLGEDVIEVSNQLVTRWKSMGSEMGFEPKTAEPSDRGHQYFMAEPTGEDNEERYK